MTHSRVNWKDRISFYDYRVRLTIMCPECRAKFGLGGRED